MYEDVKTHENLSTTKKRLILHENVKKKKNVCYTSQKKCVCKKVKKFDPLKVSKANPVFKKASQGQQLFIIIVIEKIKSVHNVFEAVLQSVLWLCIPLSVFHERTVEDISFSPNSTTNLLFTKF